MASALRVFLDVGIGSNLRGRVEFELFDDVGEKFIENFVSLCTGSVETLVRGRPSRLTFVGSQFFEIVQDEYIRGGDLQFNNGDGGESVFGPTFKERCNARRHSLAGLLSMHKMPNGGFSSQFYITLGMCAKLDLNAVVIGKVVNGMEFVRALGFVPIDSKFKPKLECGILNSGLVEVIGEVDRDKMRAQRLLVERLFLQSDGAAPGETLERSGRGNVDVVETKNPYGNRRIFKRVPNANTASEIGRRMLQEAMAGVVHHYCDLPSTSSGASATASQLGFRGGALENSLNRLGAEAFEGTAASEGTAESDQEDDDLADLQEIDDNMLARLRALHEGINECKRLNAAGTILDDSDTAEKGDSAPKGDDATQPTLSKVLTKTASAVEFDEKRRLKKLASAKFGWNVFNQDALYRAHEKRVDKTRFNAAEYQYQKAKLGDAFYTGNVLDVDHVPTEAAKRLILDNLASQDANKAKYSRRRMHQDEAQDIDYINKRNRIYNQKLQRSFATYSTEIKQNLERGTAL